MHSRSKCYCCYRPYWRSPKEQEAVENHCIVSRNPHSLVGRKLPTREWKAAEPVHIAQRLASCSVQKRNEVKLNALLFSLNFLELSLGQKLLLILFNFVWFLSLFEQLLDCFLGAWFGRIMFSFFHNLNFL